MTENMENNGCLKRDSAEHEKYAEASRSFNRIWKERDSAQPELNKEKRDCFKFRVNSKTDIRFVDSYKWAEPDF